MKEWRRTLKSWPKETTQVANFALLPEWAREAAKERLAEQASPKRRKLKIALLIVGLAAFAIGMEFRSSSDPSTWVILALALSALPLVDLSIKRSRERTEARRRHRTIERLEACGEATLGGDFVGVSYAREPWTYPGLGSSVDEGVLLLDLDRMTFVGNRTRFDLPAQAIMGTEIRQVESGAGIQPRLCVDWASDGGHGTFSLTLPYRPSLRQSVADASDLQERIERWRRDPFPNRSVAPLLPLSMEIGKKVAVKTGIGWTAGILAGLTTFVSMIGLMGGLEFLCLATHHREWSRHAGGLFSSFSFLWIALCFVLAAKIEPRLPERYRYRPKIEPDVREALRKVEASTIAEPAVDARLKQ